MVESKRGIKYENLKFDYQLNFENIKNSKEIDALMVEDDNDDESI